MVGSLLLRPGAAIYWAFSPAEGRCDRIR